MSRQLRLEFPGAIWHITSRGNERRPIYRDDDDRRLFLRLLSRVVRERRWRLHAWVLMPNHYHLLLETPEVGLSRGMRWLNQVYAESFNERHDRVGHLFQGRFKGILVEREGHLLELVRYIVLNPVRAGLVQFAGDFAWSNYRATAGLQPAPKWLDVDWTREQFAVNVRDACEAYRRFVAEGRGASYNPWERIAGQIYLGSERFRETMQAIVDARRRSFEHPRPQRVPVRPALDALVRSMSVVFEVDAEALRTKSHGVARKALAQLAVDEGGITMRVLGDWMHATPGAVSKLRAASYELYATDSEYRRKIDDTRAALSQLSRCDPEGFT